jgi:hypothetical protein
MKIAAGIVVGIAVLVLMVWAGLQVKPTPFEPVPGRGSTAETVPLPGDLPLPVERFYRKLYGDRVPVFESAVISGRGTMRIGGIRFPARYRFIHQAGSAYRHYIETTIFGRPILTVNEYYVDGTSRMELPFGVTEDDPNVNQGANLALWAESLAWFPGVLITDERPWWEPIDDGTALLVVPYGDTENRLIVDFDPETGLFERAKSMRYREPASKAKTLWINEASEWTRVDGQLIPTVVRLTWGDEGSPWAIFTVDKVFYNTDVEASLRPGGM